VTSLAHKVRRLIVLCLLGVLALPSALHAAGELDPSFDGDGRVVTDFGADDPASGVAIDAGGKIVVAGRTEAGGNPSNFALARYKPDGSLDASFDGDGKVVTDFGADDGAAAVAIEANGKIVAAGFSGTGANPNNFALARYNDDGSLDATFDSDGRVVTDFGIDDVILGVAIQADGKIVAAGYTDRPNEALDTDFALARYNTDGRLDQSFDGDGKAVIDLGSLEIAFDVAIQADGKIVVAGMSRFGGFSLARYNANGSLDATFDGDGVVGTDFGLDAEARGVAIQADGKIVAAGRNGTDFALARYNPTGSLDSAFDGDGKALTDFGGNSVDQGRAVAIRDNGRILVAGYSGSGGGLYDFALARYTPDGSLDQGFDGDGRVVTDFGGHEIARDVAIQLDGGIVAAGLSSTSSTGVSDFAVARYLADADLAVTTTVSGSGRVGEDLTYELTVTNFGPSAAPAVTLSSSLAPGLILASASASTGSCQGTICDLGSLAKGARATVTVVATPTGGGSRAHTATVSTSDHDPYPANNTDVVTTAVTGPACTITGSQGADSLTGTAAGDVICGLGGDDSISGGDGSDMLVGGSGADNIDGGALGDVLAGGTGSDTLKGGSDNDSEDAGEGDDTLDQEAAANGADSLYGGEGRDTIDFGARTIGVAVSLDDFPNDGDFAFGARDNVGLDVENVIGGSGSDMITGSDQPNDLAGGGDVDYLQGRGGDDTLRGGDEGDTLDDGLGNDRNIGGDGNDTFNEAFGADHQSGGAGFDTADYGSRIGALKVSLDDMPNDGQPFERDNVRRDVENIVGGAGPDTLKGSAADNSLFGGDGNDQLSGLGGEDKLTGAGGSDQEYGGDNNDRFDQLEGFEGADLLSGGNGTDEVDYRRSFDPVTITLDGIQDDGAPGELDNVLSDVENVTTGNATDVVLGNSANNSLGGRERRDQLGGGLGDDTLDGGAGDDVLDGGPGADQLKGQDDRDRLLANDGTADTLIDCGNGNDVALVDPADPATIDCEIVLVQ
jgi:uncharacterized delta-60 repeat protein/uncharacterized repeat protein (TIGR01451 family)